MSQLPDEELEEFRAAAFSEAARRAFRASAAATLRRERTHPGDVNAVLGWIDELRRAFGEPPVDRRPWRGSDFRL
jgi:hypothetical protein